VADRRSSSRRPVRRSAAARALGRGASSGVARRARAAQPGWNALGHGGRARILLRAQRWLVDNRDRVVETIVSETGKTYDDALIAEVNYTASAFGFWAKNAPKFMADERIKTSSPMVMGRKLVVRYQPLGLVGVIGPWNYPLTNSFGDCIPALAAGNSVILKPSEVTPMTSLMMAEGAARVRPARGTSSRSPPQGRLGRGAHRRGRHGHVHRLDAHRQEGHGARAGDAHAGLARAGGKDPMIVLSDADLERAANAAVYYSMQNRRPDLHLGRARLRRGAGLRRVRRQGHREGARAAHRRPDGFGAVDVGAVTSPPQMDIIEAHVEDARAKGANVVVGGHRRPGPGDFFEPTVMTGVDHSMQAMTEETFGPTLPIMKVGDAEEAIRLANDSPYGLSARCGPRTSPRARRSPAACSPAPSTSTTRCSTTRRSSCRWAAGRRRAWARGHGAAGIRKYCAQQSILVTRFAPKKDVTCSRTSRCSRR
jgi:acyl-CoA reductase-like NAD-dependent aldehyde dehydrogenase